MKTYFRSMLAWWGLTILACSPLYAASHGTGILNIVVQDENGNTVKNANLYICRGEKSGRLLEVRGGSTQGHLILPIGTYRVYAGLTKTLADFSIEHYASPEAHFELSEHEPTSLILILEKSQDVPLTMTEASLKKMGLSPDLARL